MWCHSTLRLDSEQHSKKTVGYLASWKPTAEQKKMQSIRNVMMIGTLEFWAAATTITSTAKIKLATIHLQLLL